MSKDRACSRPCRSRARSVDTCRRLCSAAGWRAKHCLRPRHVSRGSPAGARGFAPHLVHVQQLRRRAANAIPIHIADSSSASLEDRRPLLYCTLRQTWPQASETEVRHMPCYSAMDMGSTHRTRYRRYVCQLSVRDDQVPQLLPHVAEQHRTPHAARRQPLRVPARPHPQQLSGT